MKMTILPKTFCPQCRHPLDAATSMDGNEMPKAGDISICIACITPLMFKDDLTLRAISTDEMKTLPDTTKKELSRMMKIIFDHHQQFATRKN